MSTSFEKLCCDGKKIAANLVMTTVRSVSAHLYHLQQEENSEFNTDLCKFKTAQYALCEIAQDLCQLVYNYIIAKGNDMIEISIANLAATINVSSSKQSLSTESTIFSQLCKLLVASSNVSGSGKLSIGNGLSWGSSLILLVLLLQKRDFILERIRLQVVFPLYKNTLPLKKRITIRSI